MLLLLSVDGTTRRDLEVENVPCVFARTKPLLYCIRGIQPVDPHPLVEIDFYGNVVRTIRSIAAEDMPASPVTPGLQLSPTPDAVGVTYPIRKVSRTLWLMDGLDKVELP